MIKLGALVVLAVVGACSYGSIDASSKPDHDAGDDAATDSSTEADADADTDAGHDGDASHVIDDGGDHDADTDADTDAALTDSGTRDPGVEPLYDAAPNWNDYVRASDPTKACTASTTPLELGVCIHAGPLRKLELPNEDSCTDLDLMETQGWFDWQCDVVKGAVVFRTLGLHAGVDLIDLIDVATSKWKTNAVTVSRNGTTLAQTESVALWNNRVHTLGAVSGAARDDLDDYGAVYVITDAPTHALRITVDKVSVLKVDGVTFSVLSAATDALLATSGSRSFLWIDLGAIDTTGHSAGIDLDLKFSQVRNLETSRPGNTAVKADMDIVARATTFEKLHALSGGVKLLGSHCAVHDIDVEDIGGACLRLGLSSSSVDQVQLHECYGYGLIAEDLSDTRVSNVRIDHSNVCVQVGGVTTSTFENFYVDRGESQGIVVGDSTAAGAAPSENDLFLNTFVTSIIPSTGMVLGGRNHRVLLTTATNNNGAGVHVDGDNMLVMHATLAQNQGAGVELAGAATSLIDAVSVNNLRGVAIFATAQNNRVVDLSATDNGSDVVVDGDHNQFSGAVKVTNSGSCTVAVGLTAAGIAAAPCSNVSPSDAVFSQPNSLTTALIGELAAGDALNGSDGTTINGSDWFTFSNRFRNWAPNVVAAAPDAGTRGFCSTSPCSIWDFRVLSTGALADRIAVPPLTALVDAAHVRTHVWAASSQAACDPIVGAAWGGATCTSTFLDYAYESTSDGVGNDNGLCEPDEDCILNRNFGGYAGEGTLELLDPGSLDQMITISGFGKVTLRRFTTNGE